MSIHEALLDATASVDPELFLWCSGVYSAAAHLAMPVPNPSSGPKYEFEGKVYAFADMPVNRGMLAVSKELHERGLGQRESMAVMMRLMHFGEVLTSPELAEFRRPAEKDGSVDVSEALIKACATAKIIVTRKGDSHFDVKDLARIARELTAAEGGETA